MKEKRKPKTYLENRLARLEGEHNALANACRALCKRVGVEDLDPEEHPEIVKVARLIRYTPPRKDPEEGREALREEVKTPIAEDPAQGNPSEAETKPAERSELMPND